jgi:hypothetical protein
MPFNNAVAKDLSASQMMLTGGSPKILYTSFLLGLIREFFSLVITENCEGLQVERGFSTLVAFCPDKEARQNIWKLYVQRREAQDGNSTSAAILSCGDLVDYLSACLDLTESSEGGFL